MKRAIKRRRKSAPSSARRRHKRTASVEEKTPDHVEGIVAAAAPALGLTLDPAWHGGVAFNLRLILEHAALVDAFDLPDDAEPASVFHA